MCLQYFPCLLGDAVLLQVRLCFITETDPARDDRTRVLQAMRASHPGDCAFSAQHLHRHALTAREA